MKEIILKNGEICHVDDDWFIYLNQWNWKLSKKDGYAVRNGRKSDGDMWNKKIWMHRVINGTPKNKITDHINGNKLDNRKENLRTVDGKQNMYNKKPVKGSSSVYKGVFRLPDGKFEVSIKINSKSVYIGKYSNEEAAANAYNLKAKELFGEYAWLNNVVTMTDSEIVMYKLERPLRFGMKKYKGVSFHKVRGKWRSYIKVNGKQVYLGLFHSETDALIARNDYCVQLGLFQEVQTI